MISSLRALGDVASGMMSRGNDDVRSTTSADNACTLLSMANLSAPGNGALVDLTFNSPSGEVFVLPAVVESSSPHLQVKLVISDNEEPPNSLSLDGGDDYSVSRHALLYEKAAGRRDTETFKELLSALAAEAHTHLRRMDASKVCVQIPAFGNVLQLMVDEKTSTSHSQPNMTASVPHVDKLTYLDAVTCVEVAVCGTKPARDGGHCDCHRPFRHDGPHASLFNNRDLEKNGLGRLRPQSMQSTGNGQGGEVTNAGAKTFKCLAEGCGGTKTSKAGSCNNPDCPRKRGSDAVRPGGPKRARGSAGSSSGNPAGGSGGPDLEDEADEVDEDQIKQQQEALEAARETLAATERGLNREPPTFRAPDKGDMTDLAYSELMTEHMEADIAERQQFVQTIQRAREQAFRERDAVAAAEARLQNMRSLSGCTADLKIWRKDADEKFATMQDTLALAKGSSVQAEEHQAAVTLFIHAKKQLEGHLEKVAEAKRALRANAAGLGIAA